MTSIAAELSARYSPFADWASFLDPAAIAKNQPTGWWQSPEIIKGARSEGKLRLSGLHIALEPGHIGGAWAEWEGRNFRMAEDDYWVREGELVLEVALRAAAILERLGAEVSLLRTSSHPVNPKKPADYWDAAAKEFAAPSQVSLSAQFSHALAVRDQAIRMAIITGELAERARLVNESIRPDALISLHINAAPWSEVQPRQLVDSDHAHVLIFGCLLASELAVTRQRERLIEKMTNGSGPIEVYLGDAMGEALADATGLPPSDYSGDNAVRLEGTSAYLWARNLMLLRLVDCPAVMLEPYIANSRTSYPRIQEALRARAHHEPLPEEDILIEYADAVVQGLLRAYGGEPR
ncbi:MAG: hypothetical protein GVY36_08140 [Verrucomicrobia bacterium]|nr:hypothetical protein [Verrucomicrobiota bacterium]